MLQAQLISPRQFELMALPTPEPGDGEVLLEVAYVAVCGSEFAPYLGTATQFPLYERIARYPRPLGHEASAVVAALGPNVSTMSVGQRVVPRSALFATHALAKAEDLVAVPDGVSLAHASLTLMGQETYYLCHEMLHIQPDDSVLVIGVGPFGMLCVEHAREIGCQEITAVDLHAARLERARGLGATMTVDATHEEVGQVSLRPAVVIETSGQPQPIQRAIRLAAPGARVALAGRPHKPLDGFTVEDIFHNMLTVIGGKIPPAGYAPHYRQEVLEMLASGRIHAEQHITHTFSLSEVGAAFEVAIDPTRGGLKVIVDCQRDTIPTRN
jgi:threonine dehydrogenase-like Zn-dependent dehydrogenase